MTIELLAMIKSLNEEKYQAFVAYLRAAREAQGLSIRDLGELIGEHNQIVHRIENGERKLTVQEYVQYCRALKIEPMPGIEMLDEPPSTK